MVEVAFRNGRALGRVEEEFAASLAPGDTFRFAGLDLEVESLREGAAAGARARRCSGDSQLYGRGIPISSHLAERVRGLLADRAAGRAFRPKSASGWRCRRAFRCCPRRVSCWWKVSPIRIGTTACSTRLKAGPPTSRWGC
jgi:ATP-dependent Lhr-like helicase